MILETMNDASLEFLRVVDDYSSQAATSEVSITWEFMGLFSEYGSQILSTLLLRCRDIKLQRD